MTTIQSIFSLRTVVLCFFIASLTSGCSSDEKDSGMAGPFKFTGRVTSPASMAPVTITHLMAVNPQSAWPDRILSEVNSDGEFEITVESGRPYVLVFIDSTQVGSDMVVAIFRQEIDIEEDPEEEEEDLDTMAPMEEGEADLGEVEADPATQEATLGIEYAELLDELALSEETAEYLGSIDDLSLRYANPDIDANGVIDKEEDKNFGLDYHLLANVKKGAGGSVVQVSDMTNGFFDDSGETVATPEFKLATSYVLYDASYDETTYVDNSAGSPTTLSEGAAFAATHADSSPVASPSFYTSLAFNDRKGWGATYNWSDSSDIELPGAEGSLATLVYTLGSTGTNLTFTNVITRTRASLTDSGTLMPFLSLNTNSDGNIESMGYKWMKRASATSWEPATQEEIDLLVNDDGGNVNFYRQAKAKRVVFKIPKEPTGTVAWEDADAEDTNVTEEELLATTPDDICSMAISYDDKLGLRIFAGDAVANDDVTPCP